jgi:predicted acylesterase/phospholipase RssA
MLRELTRAGFGADFVVGSSVGAMNAAHFAGVPDAAGVEKLEKIWLGLRRQDGSPWPSLKVTTSRRTAGACNETARGQPARGGLAK